MQAVTKIGQRTISENEGYLLVSFRNGDKDAFRRVYDRMCKPLLYFVQNIINSQVDAEDIVAGAFCKLYDVRGNMESYEHIKRWLYVIARNRAIDHLRAQAKSREAAQQLLYLGEDKEGLDLEMLKTNLLQSLAEEIEKLPRQRKTILRLYFFEQKTTAEIAEQLQLSAQTVLNHKTRALDALRKTILRPEWLAPGILIPLLLATFFLVSK